VRFFDESQYFKQKLPIFHLMLVYQLLRIDLFLFVGKNIVHFALIMSFIMINVSTTNGQDRLNLFNSSFEKDVHQSSRTPWGWYPFPDDKTSSPDIHSRYYTYFEVKHVPSDGDRFISMVTRPDRSTEGICQFLEHPILTENKYRLKMDLSFSETFESKMLRRDTLVSFNHPCVIEVWGFNRFQEKDTLLAVTPTIDHQDWKTYNLMIDAEMQINDLCLIASFPDGTITPRPGNILLDNIQPIEGMYNHPALPTEPSILQSKSNEDLSEILRKVNPELKSNPQTSANLKIFLALPEIEKSLSNQTIQNYIFNTDREKVLRDLRIMDAINAKHLSQIIRRSFRAFIHPDQATQEDADYFSSSDALFKQASAKKSLATSKLEFLNLHRKSFIEEVIELLY